MKGRRKGIQIALAVLMIVSAAAVLAFTGCGGGDGGPTGDETIKIKYSQPHPAIPGYWGSPASEASMYYWEEAVEAVTEGRIDIEIYVSETLNKQELAYDAVMAGVADIAWSIASYSPEWTPLELVLYLPLDMDSLEMNMQIHRHLYEEYFLPEYEARGLINIGVMGREKYIVFSPYKPIYTLEEFEGVTIMTSGRSMEELISRLRGLSITLAWQDCYEALEKGTLDCSALDITLPIVFGWWETGDPGYIIDCGGLGNAVVIFNARADLVDKLRPEDYYALMKLTDIWLVIRGSILNDAGNILYWDEVPKLGMEFIDWPESEKERLRELKREVYDWWIDWMEDEYGLGEQAAEVLEAVLEEMENFKPGNHLTPINPVGYPDQWMIDRVGEFGWVVDEEFWQEWVGPDGHWGMDYVYDLDGFEPWYEKWWDEQNMEHPWYENWKQQQGK